MLYSPLQISQTYLKKSKQLTNLIVCLGRLQTLITDNDLLVALTRRIKQQNEVISKSFVRNSNEFMNFFCENDTKLTWDAVTEELVNFLNSRTEFRAIDIDELFKAAMMISENVVTDERDLNFNLTPEKTRKIVQLMPVLLVKKKSCSYFINLHEFVYIPGVFETIFLNEENETENPPEEVIVAGTTDRGGIGGRKSIVSKFPQIIDEVAEFIKQHGFAAQNRRRTDIGYSCGVTIKQIQTHLYKTFPDLKQHKMSLSTIRRMFEAPNKHFKAAERYKGLLNVRVGTKQNAYREYHPDAHYLFARNKMRREFASLFSQDIAILSVDDMAKVKVGAPAVSRYHQIKRLFLDNDRPNLNDHDFPVPGYLLNVSGHMFLESKDFSESNELNMDAEPVTFDHNDNSLDPDFSKMVTEDLNHTFFDSIRRQASRHLNIQISEKECMDGLKDVMKEQDEHLVDTLKKQISFASLDVAVAAVANFFKCKVVMFYKDDGEDRFNVISPDSQPRESPMYLFRERKN